MVMEIEEVLSSKPRLKILKLLAQKRILNISEIARNIGLNYKSTDQHLRMLEIEHVLQQRRIGRIRMYKFDESSAKAKALENLIETWANP
jgi:DNA-binding transcriptional ArsR family regulator